MKKETIDRASSGKTAKFLEIAEKDCVASNTKKERHDEI